MQTQTQLLSVRTGAVPTDAANALLRKIGSISKIDFQSSTYEDITNSGQLNIMTDFQLKKKIIDYHIALTGVQFIDDYFYCYFNDFVMLFIFSHFNLLEGKLADPNMRRTTLFANVVAGYYSIIQQRNAAYQELLQQSIQLKYDLQTVIDR